MRVLIISMTYPPADISGVGVLVHELAHQLGDGGHHVRVITRRPPKDDAYALGVWGPKLLFPLTAVWRYLRLAATSSFDLVHVHESDGVFVALILRCARLLRWRAGTSRLVATLHVSYVRERRSVRAIRANGRIVSRPTASERLFAWVRAPIHSLLGQLTGRLADAVVTSSRVTAGELEEDYGVRVAAVIPNGVSWWPTDSDRPAGGGPTALESQDASHPVVLYVGRMRTRKAVAVLLEAFSRVLKNYPRASLILAGNGEHREALERRVQTLGLDRSIRFLGAVPREQMGRWYDAADIFCLPSIYEGFPLVILEAMAAGLPVVSTTVSGIPEAVEEGVTGLLVEPEDADGLARALEQLAAAPELCKAMGTHARRMVQERYSIRKICGDYLNLWQGLVSRHQKSV